ncbi:hypothetical protein ACOSP7_007109 [Xanthoceras sorbifolium]
MVERFVFTSQPAPERMKAADAGPQNPCKRARSFCDEPSTKLGDCDRCGCDKGCCRRADGDGGDYYWGSKESFKSKLTRFA